ncbi:MAG: MoaD/ThiS family protein [Deltaproteobacteria bacterium]|nr:MoaD/ThiS family protein [Deltaproteobacteria bacterium]MBW2154047.1 MoaD/ThiS family protein [Deltaproteobacteria bacterium]
MEDQPIHVKVRLFSYLKEYAGSPDGIVRVDLAKGAQVKDIFHSLGIENIDVALIMINQNRAKLEDIVSDGDFVEAFPAVGGG